MNSGNDRSVYKRTEINGGKYYGKHLMVTAVSCNENILNIDTVSGFLEKIVPAINMTAFGEPVIAKFGEGVELGISAVQLITTSAITIHTNDAFRDMYLDVFSCKWFDEEIVLDMLRDYFSPEEIKENIVLRK